MYKKSLFLYDRRSLTFAQWSMIQENGQEVAWLLLNSEGVIPN
jgi:hypothetical protein